MTQAVGKAATKNASVRAVVTRGDGRVEDLGLVSYYHRNPLIRVPVNLWLWVRNTLRSWR